MFIRSAPRRLAHVLLVLAAVMGLAACGEPEKLPADTIIERAVPAIQAANSFHFNLETSKLEKAPPGLFISKVDGDVVKPDKLSGSMTASFSGLPSVNVKVVVDGQSQYMTDPISGKWAAMSSAFNVAEFFNPSKGIADILANVKGLGVDGTENVAGTDSYRLKGTVPATALKSLTSEVTATGDLATTLWIGAGDFLLRRVQLQGPLLEGEPADIARTITLTEYNKAVKIETPVVK